MNITPNHSWPLMAVTYLFSVYLPAQSCETVNSTVGTENNIFQVEEGSEFANLELYPLLGDVFTFPQQGQLVEGAEVTSAFEYRVKDGTTCSSISSGAPYPVDIIKFQPSLSATVRIQQAVPNINTDDYSFTLFQESFDPAIDNCEQFVASSFQQNLDGTPTNLQFTLEEVNLVGGQVYFLVILPGQSSTRPYPRDYSVEINPINGSDSPQYYDVSVEPPPSYDFTFIAVEDQTPFNILGVSSTGDFRDLPAADENADTTRIYNIYSVNYDPARVDTLDLMNAELNDVLANDNGKFDCLQLSSESVEIGINKATAAPVDWLTFTATPIKQAVKLDWDVAAETENDYFRVERSVDGTAWTDIGEVSGNGTTQTYAAFTFTDLEPVAGANYYRLAQIDFDGTENLSVIVQASLGNTQETLSMTTYPNPFTNHLRLTTTREEEGPIRIFDMQGRDLTGRVAIARSSGTDARVTAAALPTGIYLISWGGERQRVVKY